MSLPFVLVTITIINHGFALCSLLGRLAVQEPFDKFLLEKFAVTPCRLVPLLRAEPRHTHPWPQHLAYVNAIVQPRWPGSALRNAVPIPLNDVLGPRFLYRDFTDCTQHVKSHPGPVRLNYLRLSVRGPLRVHAPLPKGFKKFLNSAPPFFGGASVETTWLAAVFARDGRCQPYAASIPGFSSFTWQRVRGRKTIS